ncbi:MAG: hypothetical protein A3H69_00440 [Candidatus Sungbacteria bacterium RIFCSPLOWO2_02_FULL_47_9]|uniref:Response regulatory domain-containing protein n=2 Tax=Parcubacteria group TaxID=1794811 RepID=A0A1G2RR34_9BACT|nr:MAG: putative response regulator [Parcubacteria group bacterium GW2011_GWA2_47_10]OGZ93967.1 MAG: hypothetical protein A2633_00810 [Candidatus Sungbacteria bacterium RIFCSPHIGHO2_01_FULL_47_32]OHA11097.1 MAG: hypothetical protein A3H69_00440 [Candidatus Sungbacteria bacterium RIFCSPLOWO2_02_FULL_47_9]OHA74918.1 MAG: hypothetical protein A3A32_03665 [Candidatus Wildermuthbacteria bacterium RIFCSPLOWO2_01_FULL_48_35]
MAKILIIEDDASLRKKLVSEFTVGGNITLEAGDGETGLAIALKEHPEAIVVDFVLPKMHGINVIKRIRADAWGQNACIAMLSNLSDPEIIQEAEKSGVSVFLTKKDTTPEEVAENVRSMIFKCRGMQ